MKKNRAKRPIVSGIYLIFLTPFILAILAFAIPTLSVGPLSIFYFFWGVAAHLIIIGVALRRAEGKITNVKALLRLFTPAQRWLSLFFI